MYSYLDHRYTVGFAFISWGVIPTGEARIQNLGHTFII